MYHLLRKENIFLRSLFGKKPSAFSFARAEEVKEREAGKRQVGTRGMHARVFRRFAPNLGASSSGQVVVLMAWRKGQGARLPNRTSDVCPVCGKSKDKPRAQRKTRTESV